MTLATCETIGDGLINWIDNATPQQVNALCGALEECTDALIIALAAGDGLALSGNGQSGSPYTFTVTPDPNGGNAVTVSPAGVNVDNAELSWNQGATTLSFTDNKGSTNSIDLSQFLTDLHVTTATYDPQTTTLTLQVDDGQGSTTPVTVNLGDLAKSETADTNTVAISGDGSANNALEADVKISAASGNSITANNDGLFSPEPTLGDLVPQPPAQDGDYALKVTISNGNPSYSWEPIGC